MERLTITPRELADALGLCLQTIHRRVRDGTIRTITLGPTKLIPASELPRLLGEHDTEHEPKEDSHANVV